MANVSSPTALLATASTLATTTSAVTTTTVAPATTTTTVAKAVRSTVATAVATAVAHVARVSTTTPPATPTTVAISVAKAAPIATTTLPPATTTTVRPVTTTTVRPKPVSLSISNPGANIAPSPNFLAPGNCTFGNGAWSCDNPCVVGTATALSWPGFSNGTACTNYILAAINNARSIEGIRPMVLPSNWYSLTTQQQLFVVTDLERTARGLPAYLGINAALSANAQHAAAAYTDPSIAAGFPIANDAQGSPGMGGAWSGGFNLLAADYIWMYADGWGGSASTTSNIVCTSARAAGCWAHRDELLGSDPGYNPGVGLGCTNCEVGTGFAMVNGRASYTVLIEIPQGSPPPMSFTWANNVLPYLP
jgi:hypothetical protein